MSPAQSPKGTVLVVDDEELVRRVASDILEYLGYRVEAVSSGEAAVERMRQGERPDVILLDVVMPGIGGLEAFRRIRALAPGVPVLVSSGFADQSCLKALVEEGVEGFIHKPYQMEALAERVQSLVK
jgi:CheY-like chemotaxis protein